MSETIQVSPEPAHESGPASSHRRRLPLLWREIQWPATLILSLAAGILGYVGFAKHAQAHGQALSPGDIFYLVLQLIPMGSGAVPAPLPWELEVARFLLPAVTGYAALSALALLFKDQLQAVRLWLLRDHIVVCGLGRTGALLVRQFRQAGWPVVVIEANKDNPLITECQALGAHVLLGNATHGELLQRAGISGARYLIAVCGNDGTNAAVSVGAHRLKRRSSAGALTCIIHVYSPQLCELLRQQEIHMDSAGAFRLEFFNAFDLGARALLQEYPPATPKAGQPAPHLVVVGLGKLGQSLVAQAARGWRERFHATGQKLRISVVDRDAAHKVETLALRYPRLPDVCSLLPYTMDVRDPEFLPAKFLFDSQGHLDVTTIYVCLDDDSASLSVGLDLLQKVRGSDARIVARMADETGLAALLRPAVEGLGGFEQIRVFPLLNRTCRLDLLLGGTHETLARAIHADYARSQQALGETRQSNPSLAPWEELPRALVESNRSQADDIGRKLKAVRCDIAPLTDWDAELFAFTRQEVEQMAQLEHQRWTGSLLRDGWRYAAGPKNAEKRTHPALVGWDALPEEEQEKDRVLVRGLPSFLASAGFQVYRPAS